MELIEIGAARGDQLWSYAVRSVNAEQIMANHIRSAEDRREHLLNQWREVNAEIASLKAHMREAGFKNG